MRRRSPPAASAARHDLNWGDVTFIVYTRDGVFETKAPVPGWPYGRGYFNIHGDSPPGGHIRADRCDWIWFVDRPFFGRRSCSLVFVNTDGEAMFKVFVGRDGAARAEPAAGRPF